MLEKQRHQLILEILAERQYASVPEFSEELNASEATIRRDIIKLAKRNQLNKIRGGAESLGDKQAMLSRRHLQGTPFLANKERHSERKRMIAKKATELCGDGDSVIINGGSSTYMMSEFLVNHSMTIMTNSFELAHNLVENTRNEVVIPGGNIYRKQSIILSSFENDGIEHFQASKLFMGTPGIGSYGVMESDPLLILTEQKLMQQAEKLVVLADSSKLDQKSNFTLCPLEDVDILITDNKADAEQLKPFKDLGIEVLIADAVDDTALTTE